MSSNYNDLSMQIVVQLWNKLIRPSWKIQHDQHQSVLREEISRILVKNVPEIEFLSLSSREIQEQIFNRNLLDISQIMELSSRGDLVVKIIEELKMTLEIIYRLIARDLPEEAEILKAKLNDDSTYSEIVEPITSFQTKANKINHLVTKMLEIISHESNQKELGINTSNPSFGQMFTQISANAKLSEEFSLYLKSLSN